MTDRTDQPTDAAEVRRWYRLRAHPHLSMLRWYRTVGYARHAGVGVDMDEPPAIAGQDIEYLPGVATRIDGRDMTDDEKRVVLGLLVQMSRDARDALAGCSTLVVSIEGAAR